MPANAVIFFPNCLRIRIAKGLVSCSHGSGIVAHPVLCHTFLIRPWALGTLHLYLYSIQETSCVISSSAQNREKKYCSRNHR
jgi:hypothetical protein